MKPILKEFEQGVIDSVMKDRDAHPDFAAGDTVRVHVKIVEGATERLQAFEGVVIARKTRGLHSTFTVRKISHNEGVVRIFPLYSPRTDKIEVVKKGHVRRAKLYYMIDLRGKAARIKEKMNYDAK